MSATPIEKLAESIGHQCQTDCGNLADVVIVQLATGETDIMCGPCHLAMMTAVMQEVAQLADIDGQASDVASAAQLAADAAAAALAAE